MEVFREELAWAAGLYDGEGCTYIAKSHGKPKIRMTITQNDPEVLERFRKAVLGLGNITGPHFSGREKGLFYWNVSSFESTQAVIGLLGTFLCSVKRNQITSKLSTATFNPPRGKICPVHGVKTETALDGRCKLCRKAYDRERYSDGRHNTNKKLVIT